MNMRLKKQQSLFLRLLERSKPRERKRLLSGAENDVIKLLSEIIYNVLFGNVPLDHDKIRQLRRHKQTLHLLAKRSVSLDRKRTILLQHGGGSFFAALYPILTSVLGSSLQ